MRFLLAVIALAISGCGTLPGGKSALIQQILDEMLPASFTGDVDISVIGGSLKASGLVRTDRGWTFTWLDYDRLSVHVRLGKRP